MTIHCPKKIDPTSDRAAANRGENFGLFARSKAMDSYIGKLFDERLAGIPLWA